MLLNVAVLDDDENICEEIGKHICDIDKDVFIKQFTDVNELLKKEKQYDIYFIDADMTGDNKENAAELIREKYIDACIILMTGKHFEKNMVQAFKIHAHRFLKKPVELRELTEAFESASNEICKKQRIIVKTGAGDEILNLSEIVVLEAFGDGTIIYTQSEIIEARDTLTNLLDYLGSSFCRTHKSFAVALDSVKKYYNCEIEMKYTGMHVPVARRREKLFREKIKEYIEKTA